MLNCQRSQHCHEIVAVEDVTRGDFDLGTSKAESKVGERGRQDHHIRASVFLRTGTGRTWSGGPVLQQRKVQLRYRGYARRGGWWGERRYCCQTAGEEDDESGSQCWVTPAAYVKMLPSLQASTQPPQASRCAGMRAGLGQITACGPLREESSAQSCSSAQSWLVGQESTCGVSLVSSTPDVTSF